MHTARLRKVGGSVMLAIPPALLEVLDLEPRAAVDMTVDRGRLVVEPRRRPRYTLADLLAQCDRDAPISEEDMAWANSSAVGDEII